MRGHNIKTLLNYLTKWKSYMENALGMKMVFLFLHNFFQIILYSDKYLAILHTNYILHMHRNKCLPSEKRVRYFCPVLTKSNHCTNATLGRINKWTDINDTKTEFLKMLFQFSVRTWSMERLERGVYGFSYRESRRWQQQHCTCSWQ